jgi:hypothetical protein
MWFEPVWALGVRGWKSDETDELTKAVEALERHDSAFSSSVSNQILDAYPIQDWLGGHRS